MDTDVFIGAHAEYFFNKAHLLMGDVKPSTLAELMKSYIMPIRFYNASFTSVYGGIVEKVSSDVPLTEVIDSFTEMEFLWFYADLSAILDYYSFPTDMVPNVDNNVISSQLKELYNLVNNIFKESNINFPNRSSTLLNMEYIDKAGFDDRYKKMAWYIYHTDVSWTEILYASIKEYIGTLSFPSPTIPIVLPTINIVENDTQIFFDNYASGIKGIRDNRKLSEIEYLTLITTWEMDYEVYTDWLKNHIDYGLVSEDFVSNMEIFIDNIQIIIDETKKIPILP